jgi:hypothetical protein
MRIRTGWPPLHSGTLLLQEENIVRAGSSGTAGFPHLHVGIFPAVVWRRTDDVALNFRNASGSVDARGALVVGAAYTAPPY